MSENSSQIVPSTSWQPIAIASVAVFLLLLWLFRSTAMSMVEIWNRSDTYAHGFLILPISAWLVWHKRAHLAAFSPTPSSLLLFIVAGALLLWGVSRLIGVSVVEQVSFVAVVIGALMSVLGWQVSKFLVFPLLFLFFAVPMGEDLTAPMMEFTATFTVEALKLTGIPVYRDGLWFSLPTGNWSVVEACSGVRYLIASVTLGVMYAYITYHTLWKRLLFIAMSAIVPIFANGIRAYMIVMIGHLSGMEHATGVDHLIYGWVFFGIVMFILFWIGSFWQEQETPPQVVVPPQHYSPTVVQRRALMTVLVVAGLSTLAVFLVERAEGIQIAVVGELEAPGAIEGWQSAPEGPRWALVAQPTDHRIEARYHRGSEEVQMLAVLFPQQREGAEVIRSGNEVSDSLVRSKGLESANVDLGLEVPVRVKRSKLVIDSAGEEQEHLAWQWYRVAGHSLSNRYLGKAWEAVSRIYPGRADGLWMVLSTPLDTDGMEAAERRLAEFAKLAVPEVYRRADAVLGIIE